MMRHVVQIALLTGILVVGIVPTTLAQKGNRIPVSTGVVATVTAVDSQTGMATLTTEVGEVFVLPKETLWKVGSKVECDRIDNGSSSRLQDCKPWR